MKRDRPPSKRDRPLSGHGTPRDSVSGRSRALASLALPSLAALALAAFALAALSSCGSESRASTAQAERGAWPSGPVRAIWVTRFDYRTAADVRAILEDCAGAGLNTVMFQVRGNANAFYRSTLEPWAAELGGEDPGFDPLALACERARELGLSLHAWVNVVPAWWGTEPPADPEHLWNRRPQWLWYDQEGRRQALSERFYASLNPCLSEVREHIAAVVGEIARYPVDGVHLDYLRFPNEPPAIPAGSGIDYPRDERTLALYRAETGLAPDDDRAAWDRWRTGCIDELLRAIRREVKAADPTLVLSAAVGPDPERALAHFQDARGWIREGLLDAVFPMNYATAVELYERRLEPWLAMEGLPLLVVGQRVDTAEPAVHEEQMRIARRRAGGFCLFAYASLFDSTNVQIAEQDREARERRARLRERMIPFLRGLAAADRLAEAPAAGEGR